MYSNIVVLLLSSTLAIKSSRAADEDLDILSRRERDACVYSHFIPSHSMCVVNLTAPEIPMSQADKDAIVSNHNRIRNEVNPPAAGMHKMVWDDELALIALTRARKCLQGHDSGIERAAFSLPGVAIGQNLYYDLATFNPVDVVLAWEGEKVEYTYDISNNVNVVGHYTEMILEKNAKVGCGMADCTASSLGKNIMVCNYGLIQLTLEVNKPYCPKNDTSCPTCGTTDATYTNLCDCGGKICFNGGAIDPSTCQCTCPTNFGNTVLSGALCETLNCETYTDGSTCFTVQCLVFGFSFAIKNCPASCNVCPSTCALTCQNGGYLNYVNDGIVTRCACYCPPGFSGADCSSSSCSLICQNGGVLDPAKCECSCSSNTYDTTCDKRCTTGVTHSIRSKIDNVCKVRSRFAFWCPRTCKLCTGRFCRNHYRGLCRYFVQRNVIKGLIAFCSSFANNECSRLCRRRG